MACLVLMKILTYIQKLFVNTPLFVLVTRLSNLVTKTNKGVLTKSFCIYVITTHRDEQLQKTKKRKYLPLLLFKTACCPP